MDGFALRALTTTVDKVYQFLQEQEVKSAESNQLLKELNTKIDNQGGVLQTLQEKIESQGRLLRTFQGHIDSHSKKLLGIETEIKVVKNLVQNRDINANKNTTDICAAIQISNTNIASFIQSSSDVMARLQSAEKVVTAMTSDMKQVMTHIEDIVENLGNDYSLTLKNIQSDLLPMKDAVNQIMTKEELNFFLEPLTYSSGQMLTEQTFNQKLEELTNFTKNSSVKQLNAVNQVMDKEELKAYLDSLTFSSDQNSNCMEKLLQFTREQIKDVKQELTGPGSIKKMVKIGIQNILDETAVESQITREFVQNSRKVRNTYRCDFLIENLKDLKPGQNKYSHLWYIDQLKTHLKGKISYDGELLHIWIVNGRSPTLFGLDKKDGSNCKVKVKLVKPGMEVNELGCKEHCYFDEKEVDPECDCWRTVYGYEVAQVSYYELFSQGWVDYGNKVVFRYEIHIL